MRKFILLICAASTLLAQSPPNPQSRVAGRFVAYSYGQWSIPLYQAPSGTGSQTFSVQYTTVTLPDGRKVMPFSTNAPVFVGTEQVTPTAVGSGCILNSTTPGVCVLTATFSNAHTNADQVKSATYGLQEALNDASAAGGGTVTIDSAWSNAGGTTAISNAATIPASTGIEDARTGSPVISGNLTGVLYDKGGAVFNVKAYGAKGDGSTNDCTAITNANTARETAGGGMLLFPTGQYAVSSACNITLAQSGTVQGSGSCGVVGGASGIAYTACASTIQSSDTTGSLFTVTAMNMQFQNIGLINTATPTAGAGVFVNGSNFHQRVSYSGSSIQGFYDDIDQVNGSLWTLTNSYLGPPIRYAIWIHDQSSEDAGNWVVSNNFINVQNNTAVAGIYMTGAGGGTIANNSIQGNPSVVGGQYGIYLNCVSCGTSTLYMANNNVTEFGDAAFYAPNAFNGIVSTGNAWWSSAGTRSPFYCGTGCTALTLSGGSIFTPSGSVAPVTVTESSSTGWILGFAPASGGQAANSIAGGVKDTTIFPNVYVNPSATLPTLAGVQSGPNVGTGYYFNFIANNDWVLGNNAYFNGSSWLAKLATASSMENAAGAIRFRVDTGLTPGNTFSPTAKFTINSDGTVQPGGAYKSSDGTSGFTGTCASTTTLTVKSGIVTGCA